MYVLLYEYVFFFNEGTKCVLLYVWTYAHARIRTRYGCYFLRYAAYNTALVCCCST